MGRAPFGYKDEVILNTTIVTPLHNKNKGHWS